MRKLLSIILMGAMSICAMAKTYYCDPASTLTKGATSWENAISPAAVRQNLSGLKDTIYFKGGTILITQLSEMFTITKSITFIGGFDPAATGTVTALPEYPSKTPTIFSGDVNGNGIPDKGDARALIRVDYSKDTAHTSLVFRMIGFDVINTYYDDEVDSPNDVLTSTAKSAALRVLCGTAFVRNCHFYNHVTPNGRGSQCVTSVGARLHMTDCELHDCISMTRGSLLRMRQYFIDDDATKPINPDCVLERCCLYNGNNMGGSDMNSAGFYGGAAQISNGPFFAINTTIANSKGYSDGGGLNANVSGATFISCTLANNRCQRAYNNEEEVARNTYGSSLHIDKDGKVRLANSIVLGPDDNGTKQYAVLYSNDNTNSINTNCISGGYNITGTYFYYKNGVEENNQTCWLASDKSTTPKGTTVQHMEDYLGTDPQMTDNGGCSKTMKPLAMQPGDNVAHLQELADQWCPSWTKVDASLDQRGYKRDAQITCVGAAAFEASASLKYTINLTSDVAQGSVSGGGTYYENSKVTITATPNQNYQFIRWSDGNTDNPRSIVLTQDTTFEALFAKNVYSISTEVNDPVRGVATGDTTVEYLETVSISATPNYGYHFTQWNDGNTDNPRQIVVTKSQTFTANFEKDEYQVITQSNQYISQVQKFGTSLYSDAITLIATPNDFCHFIGWSDGNKDNPRTIIVTQDTVLTALAAMDYSGYCGDYLQWQYYNNTLQISGVGTMYDYSSTNVPWQLFKDSITNIVIENGCTSIGDYAFYGCANKNFKSLNLPNGILTIGAYSFANCSWLKSVVLGIDMEELGNYVFNGDQRLIYVNCLAVEPPLLGKDPFENYDAYLKVPCEAKDEYAVYLGWKNFTNVSCIGAEEESTTEVIVTPDDNSVTITWPTVDDAATYSIEIKQGDIVFCVLTFNAQGQLINIAFAPGRGTNNAITATAVAGGYRFTVTSLDPGTSYTYEVEAQDIGGTSIASHSGSFTTTGGTPTSVNQLTDSPAGRITKIIKDGQLLILRDGKTYNAQGGEVR